MNVSIHLFNEFKIVSDGVVYDSLTSRKGIALMKFLIMQRGAPVTSQRLMREFASDSANPESATKTLISRTRAMLNGICPGLGGCIASEKGRYSWATLPGVTVDALEAIELLEALKRGPAPEARIQLTERLMAVYTGELEDEYWLHREYLEAVYKYVELLRAGEAYNQIVDVCRRALAVDDLDEHLHILLIEAMVNLNRSEAALEEYQKVARQTVEYFDAEQSDELKASYAALVEEGQSLKFNLDVIHNELTREEQGHTGPYFCEYRAFKEIYNIQMRNLERLGATMFLGVIMLGSKSTASREGGMGVLQEILRTNLRKGDIVTRFSENIIAMLLPMVNYSTGAIVMERIERLFFAEFPGSAIAFHSRISPLGGRQAVGPREG